jgi:hypothetical protein
LEEKIVVGGLDGRRFFFMVVKVLITIVWIINVDGGKQIREFWIGLDLGENYL